MMLMKNLGPRWLVLVTLVGGVAALTSNFGCGGDDGGTGAGGRGGRGGGTAGSGAAGRGGAAGGATAGRGGGTAGSAAGTGGSSVAGTGGGVAGTGVSGSGGSTGGSGGTGGGAPALNCPIGQFATTDEGFVLNTFNTTAGNLVNKEAGAKATAAFTNTMGDPAVGSIRVDAPYDDYNQFIDLQKSYGATMLKNWTGATKLHVKVKVASGLDPVSSGISGGVQPYVQTTSGYVDCRAWTNIPSGNTNWNTYDLDFASCTNAAWKISEVIAVGVVVHTGDGLLGDAGVNTVKPTTAVIYVDSFWLDGTCTGGTGGTGGGAGGAAGGAGGAAGGTAGAAGGAAGAAGRGGAGGVGGLGGLGGLGGVGGLGGLGGGLGGLGGGLGGVGGLGLGGAAGGAAGAAGHGGAAGA
jgi:hypothetical protein